LGKRGRVIRDKRDLRDYRDNRGGVRSLNCKWKKIRLEGTREKS